MRKTGWAGTVALIAGWMVLAACARASTINFGFDGTLQTGSLAGIQFTGSGSYDNTGETGVGTEYFFLTALNFTVDGMAFDRSGISQGGQAILQNGVFQYFTAAYFPQTGPFDDFALGFGGPGSIGYSTPPGFNYGAGVYTLVAPVPEPPTLVLEFIGLLVLVGGGFGLRQRLV